MKGGGGLIARVRLIDGGRLHGLWRRRRRLLLHAEVLRALVGVHEAIGCAAVGWDLAGLLGLEVGSGETEVGGKARQAGNVLSSIGVHGVQRSSWGRSAGLLRVELRLRSGGRRRRTATSAMATSGLPAFVLGRGSRREETGAGKGSVDCSARAVRAGCCRRSCWTRS